MNSKFSMIGPTLVRLVVDGSFCLGLGRESTESGIVVELMSREISENPELPQLTVSESCFGVIRGIHCSPYQKTVCCMKGRAFDVVVDLRAGSPTFMKWDGSWITRGMCVIIPPYCGHAFFAAEQGTTIGYLQNGCFSEPLDFSVVWNDETVGVRWPEMTGDGTYVISDKDRANKPLTEGVTKEIAKRMENERLKIVTCVEVMFAFDGPEDIPVEAMEAVRAKGKKCEVCSVDWKRRETLGYETRCLRASELVVYVVTSDDTVEVAVSVVNMAANCEKDGVRLIIVNGGTVCEDLKRLCDLDVQRMPESGLEWGSFLEAMM